ncbi:MAG: branched-chain amino acid ABC transporter permease [Chloroflexi bacterium]|nr:branched-chain amino acid ABC transporter permease [Chloroflexota bacterium]
MFTDIIETRWLVVALGVLASLLGAPFIAPEFYTYVLTLIFVTAILAMSLNLVLGYGGIYQFHHAAFYGVGAYAAALGITKMGMPVWLAFILAPLIAAFAGLVIGWFCIRLTRLYFGMLQISLGSLIWVIVLRWSAFTSGDDGIHGIPLPAPLETINGAYFLNLAIALGCLVAMYFVIRSPFGATLQAIRDNAARCEAVGINVRNHQLAAIVIAAFFGGIAGVMFVVLERSVFPGMLFWSFSLDVFVMCLLGGWFTFAGPMVGAALVILLRTFASRYTEYWTLLLGVILILLIFFLPEGIMGFVSARFKPREPDGGAA